MILAALSALWAGLLILLQFIATLVIGILAAIVWALPWLLRLGAVIAWLAGHFTWWAAVERLYGPLTPRVPLTALEAAPIVIGIAVALYPFYKGQAQKVWGALYFWGATGLTAWWLTGLSQKWLYAPLTIPALPSAALVSLMVYSVLRAKLLRKEVMSV